MTDLTPLIVPFGMGVLPQGISEEDPRLPVVRLNASALRFNTEPMPAAAMNGDISRHEVRLAMMKDWLNSGCGNYAPRRFAFIAAYLAFISDRVSRAREFLEGRLAPFTTLYAYTDWIWSALRPIPRAWIKENGRYRMVDFAFWDGVHLTEFTIGARNVVNAVSDDAMRDPDTFFASRLPRYGDGWIAAKIPSSPFRQKFMIEGD